MYEFTYHRATSVADAAAKVAANPDAKPLAGGQTLIAAMKLRLAAPPELVDLGGVAELKGISLDGANLVIGAMTRHAEVAASTEVAQRIPALARLAAGIGDPMVRNLGTIGGSLATSDPAADYPAGVLGLGATIRTNTRSIAADDFFLGMYETALQPGELIVDVRFPVPQRAGYVKFSNPASRYAIVGVFVSSGPAGTRVAVTGAGPSAFRVPDMEQALAGRFAPDAVAGVRIASAPLNTDLHASAEYRAHLVTVLARRAVEQALVKN
jgi:aerobic carbon-monoxide dehydrogenase medium subunit